MSAPADQGTGFIGSLSLEQCNALEDLKAYLREEIRHPRFTDTLLLRFLRSKNFDVQAAAENLRTHLEFRKQMNLDAMSSGSFGSAEHRFQEFSIATKKYYPHGYHGTDRQGRPLYIERLGGLNPQALLTIATPEQMLEYFAYESEQSTISRLPACSLAAGHLVETSMSILDLQGLKFEVVTNSTVLKLVQAIARDQEKHFPSVMSTMIIVNAPAVFSIAWKGIKPWLDPRTVNCIEIFSSSQFALAQERLLELVAPEELPSFLGGCCCKCEGDCLLSNRGPWSDPDIKQVLSTKPYWEIVASFVEGRAPVDSEKHGKDCNEQTSEAVGACIHRKGDDESSEAVGACSNRKDHDDESTEADDDCAWHTPRSVDTEDFQGEDSNKSAFEECSQVSGFPNWVQCRTEDVKPSLATTSSSMDEPEEEEEPSNTHKSHLLSTALRRVSIHDDNYHWTPRFQMHEEAIVMGSLVERLQPFINDYGPASWFKCESDPGCWWNCTGSRSKRSKSALHFTSESPIDNHKE